MPRTLPSQALRLIASIAAIVLLAAYTAAAAPQKPAPPMPTSQAQLEARVKDLETRLAAAEQKAASAAMEKDYITRVQAQYERYYEKAFNTQVTILSVIALFITIVFGLAARFGFGIFDRTIQLKLTEASTQLRTEFTQSLEKETQALRDANSAQLKALENGLTKQITEQVENLNIRSEFQFQFAQGLAAAADERFADARASFRNALQNYKLGKSKQLVSKRGGAQALRNIFVLVKKQNKENFAEIAKIELVDELYNNLEDELAQATLTLRWLIPVLFEKNLPPSQQAAPAPKANKTEPTAPTKAATRDGDE
jgi:hypothetical protein